MSWPLVVVPRLRTPSWDGGDPADAVSFPLVSWEEFAAPLDTDALAAPYLVRGEDQVPRLGKAAPAALEPLGVRVVLAWAFVDLDRDPHEAWPDLTQGAVALLSLLSNPDLPPGAGGYVTPRGLRLVWPLEPALPVALARSWLAAFLAALPEVEGLTVDLHGVEWHRLYYTPRCTRDGVQLDPVVVRPTAALDPYAFGFDLVPDEDGEAAGPTPDMPQAPEVLTYEQWRAAWVHPDLRAGKPVPADAEGHRYPVMRRWLADVAETGAITDPVVLMSMAWRTTENTPGLELPAVWKLAAWAASTVGVKAASERAQREEDGTEDERPPAPATVAPDAWAAMRRKLQGAEARLLDVMRAGLPIASDEGRARAVLLRMANALVERNVTDPHLLYGFVAVSAQAAGVPADEVWERCREAAAAFVASDEAGKRVFLSQYPLTIKQVGSGGALFQLDTTVSPYVYRSTDQQLIYQHFDKWTAANLPFEAEYPSSLPLSNILRMYGASVDKVVYKSGQHGTEYDAVASVISQGVHQLSSAEPVYHDDINTWLCLLGESDPERMLDWCAALTFTPSDTVGALYLEGQPGCGKTFFATCCASLWSSAAVSFESVSGEFQGGLLDSPVLLVDEKLSTAHGPGAADKFRSLVGNRQHTINPKFGQPAELFGCFRLVIAANDANGLPFREALGADGIDAITQRVVHLTCSREAKDYLEGCDRTGWLGDLGGPGKVAQHLLWLRDNRPLTRAGRFLVAGVPTEWHRRFTADQGYKPAVMAVISHLVSVVRKGGTQAATLLVRSEPDKEVVWVWPDTVFRNWGLANIEVRRPKANIIYETLEMLSARWEGQAPEWTGDPRQPGEWIPVPYAVFDDARIPIDEVERG